MNHPPPFAHPSYLRQKDDEHRKLLAVFHFVLGGLAILGIAFLLLHYLLMSRIMTDPKFLNSPGVQAPPKDFFKIFIWFYFIMGGVMMLGGIANILSGVFLLRKKHRTFSFVIAGLNCLQIPFGTVLGIFTILVLGRESVRQSYDE